MRRNSTTVSPHKQKSDCTNCALRVGQRGTLEQSIASIAGSGIVSDFEVKERNPVRAATLEADVIVPVAQALATGLMTTALSYTVAGLAGLDVRAVGTFGVGSLLATWIKLLVDSRRNLAEERRVYVFANRSKEHAGRPTASDGTIRLEVVTSVNGIKNKMQYLDLPSGISEADFVEFCRQVLAGKSLARTNWAGSGKLFSRDVYDGLMACLLDAGIIEKKEKGGKTLSNGGRRAVEHLMLPDGKSEENAPLLTGRQAAAGDGESFWWKYGKKQLGRGG